MIHNYRTTPFSGWQDAVFSPGGTQVAYIESTAQKSTLYIAGLDGTIAKQIPIDGYEFWPSWSPDGRSIALFTSSQKITLAGQCNVTVVSTDTGKETTLAEGAECKTDFPAVPPAWSSDGTSVMFQSGSDAIEVARLDGTAHTNVPFASGGELAAMPTWTKLN